MRVDNVVLIYMPRRDQYLFSDHEVTEDTHAKLTVGDQPQRRVELLPERLLGTKGGPVHEPLAGVGEGAHENLATHAHAVVDTLDKFTAILVDALLQLDRAVPSSHRLMCPRLVLSPSAAVAACVEGVLVKLTDRQIGLTVQLAAHE